MAGARFGLAAVLFVPNICVAQSSDVPVSPISSQSPVVIRDYLEREVEAGQSETAVARMRLTPRQRHYAEGMLHLLRYRSDPADSALLRVVTTGDTADQWAAYAWLGRAQIAARASRGAEAAAFATRARELARLGGLRDLEAEALLRLAADRGRRSGRGGGLAALDTADQLLAGSSRRLRATAVCVRASVGAELGDSALVVDAAARGERLARTTGAHAARDLCRFALGRMLADRNVASTSAALRALRLSAEGSRQRRDAGAQAAALQWIGWSLYRLVELRSARRHYEDAATLAARSGVASTEVFSRLGLAAIAADLGDDRVAVQQLRRVLALVSAQDDPRAWQVAQRLDLVLRIRQGGAATAGPLLDALERSYARRGDSLGVWQLHELRGLAARAGGDLERAQQHVDELMQPFRRTGGASRPTLQHRLQRVTLLLERQQLDSADMQLRDIATTVQRSASPIGYVTQARRAQLAMLQGNLGAAERLLRDADARLIRWRTEADDDDLPRNAASMRAFDQVDPDLYIASILSAIATGGRPEAAFGMASERRARGLSDAVLRTVGAADLTLGPARRALEQIEQTRDVAGVQAALRDDEAMLFYVTGERREPTTIFVVTTSSVQAVEAMSADALWPLVERFRRLVEGDAPSDALARQIGAAVLDPVLPLLPTGVQQLLIVPDGPVRLVPMDVLRLPDGRRVVERYALATVPAPGLLVLARAASAPTRSRSLPAKLTAIAVGTARLAGKDGGRELPPLPWAEREVRAVARSFRGEALVLAGVDGSTAALKAHGRADVLHIAAHTLIDDAEPASTALLLSPRRRDKGTVRPTQLAEMAGGTPIVILSACRTAGAPTRNGEGLGSFVLPLLASGTRVVISTNWLLPDDAGAEMMRDFHRAAGVGATVGVAMRQAKLRQIAKGAPPSRWATFSVMGDPSARFPQPSGPPQR